MVLSEELAVRGNCVETPELADPVIVIALLELASECGADVDCPVDPGPIPPVP